ncbi:MAG: EF-hand domain-containing protein [Betaproteobacteria bacterium]|nr:EF-hand domain-containing protein [Betaproteobacteria bacterium]
MKATTILAAAVFATFAVSAQADFFAPRSTGAGYGPGAGPGAGMRGAGMLDRVKAADTNGDGMISREEAQASLPRLAANFDAIDANKDGFISLAEIEAARAAHGPAGRGEGWKKWDTNGDGKLSRDEVANAPRLAQEFDALDTNKDGFLSAEELQNARRAHVAGGPNRGEGWKKLDANGDGRLSRDEVANAPRLLQDFDAIDTNKDGFLSAEELQAARGRYAGRGRPS